jgi:hypothetical protein
MAPKTAVGVPLARDVAISELFEFFVPKLAYQATIGAEHIFGQLNPWSGFGATFIVAAADCGSVYRGGVRSHTRGDTADNFSERFRNK